MAKNFSIVHVATVSEAQSLLATGFCPVECSIGGQSIMDSLCMDHHGKESHREGVALRAYRDHFGALRDDPCFAVTGQADADATFAIAALAGLLPHPSRVAELEKAPPHVKAAGTRDLTTLAALVNRVDTAPIGVRLEESEDGVLLLLWNQLGSGSQDAISFYAGVDRWRALLGRSPKALLAAARQEEALRVTEARAAPVVKISDAVYLVSSSVWGFDVWYADYAPVVVAYVATNQNVTVGVKDDATAEALFGKGGLKNVFPKLEPLGWGGRESIGGSPRGVKLTPDQAMDAARLVAASVIK